MTTQAETNGQKTDIVRADPRQMTLKRMFENDATKAAIKQVVPKHLTAERVLKVALAATARTPKLLECSVQSILQSVMQAAQLGLEPGSPLGHAYLVPYGKECTLIVGYKGLIDLARRSGQVDGIEARAVYEKDEFAVEYGLQTVLRHKPFLGQDRGALHAVYAIGRLKDSEPQIEVMAKHEVDAIRARSRSGGSGPWQTDYTEMARKTVVRRLCKYLPLSVDIKGQKVDVGAAVDEAEEPTSIDAESIVTAPNDLEAKLEQKAREVPPGGDLDSEFGSLPGEQP